MAFKHGTYAEFTLGAVDISDYIEGIDISFDRDTADIRTLGGSWGTSLPGVKSVSGSIDGVFDPTLDAAVFAAWTGDTAVAFVYYPQGNTSGLIKYSGTCRISRYAPGPAGSGDAVKASFDFASEGEVLRATV